MFTKEEFTHLANTYMDMIFRLAFSYLKNREDADDVTQNVLISLYRADKVFHDREHLKSWLIRVTINECKKLLRSPWRRQENIDDYAAEMPFDTERQCEMFYAIMALEAKYRAVIVLYYYEGYSISEIAGLLNIPAGTVGTRMARARRQLKTILIGGVS